MENTKFLKTCGTRMLMIGILLLLDLIILQGGLFVGRIRALPARADIAVRLAPEEKPKINLAVTSFSATPSNKSGIIDGLYRKSLKINFSCTFENTSTNEIETSKFLIRTPKKEIISKSIPLAPEKTLTLEEEFTPEETGMLIVACRADADRVIAESDENDNREIISLVVY